MSWTMDGLRHKGIPLGVSVDAAEVGELGWVVPQGDTGTPVATLSVEDLEHNAAAMADYCARTGALLAPHAKTSLSPELLALQMRHGAWGMTAALPRQVALVWDQGIERVLVANEITDPAALQWLSAQLNARPDRELWLYADSIAAVDLLRTNAAPPAGGRPIGVLVELGQVGGRTGCRTTAEAREVAEAVRAAPELRLAGVAAYEGTISTHRDEAAGEAVNAFLDGVATFTRELVGGGVCEVEQPVVTAGGSVWFDRVVQRLGPAAQEVGARLVLRSGCYLFHDHGMYAVSTPSADRIADAPAFRPALSVWARVLSRPEPGLLLVDAGRRDLSHDAGLPVPLSAHRPGAGVVGLDLAALGAEVRALSDQHAFVHVPDSVDVAVGDLVRLGISHPCTTLDRWPVLLLTDASWTVVGAVRTQF
jgi:D-serine deaminase-like pyridoxal phosphate-dependent protein